MHCFLGGDCGGDVNWYSQRLQANPREKPQFPPSLKALFPVGLSESSDQQLSNLANPQLQIELRQPKLVVMEEGGGCTLGMKGMGGREMTRGHGQSPINMAPQMDWDEWQLASMWEGSEKIQHPIQIAHCTILVGIISIQIPMEWQCTAYIKKCLDGPNISETILKSDSIEVYPMARPGKLFEIYLVTLAVSTHSPSHFWGPCYVRSQHCNAWDVGQGGDCILKFRIIYIHAIERVCNIASGHTSKTAKMAHLVPRAIIHIHPVGPLHNYYYVGQFDTTTKQIEWLVPIKVNILAPKH